jgi:hypothetical protein
MGPCASSKMSGRAIGSAASLAPQLRLGSALGPAPDQSEYSPESDGSGPQRSRAPPTGQEIEESQSSASAISCSQTPRDAWASRSPASTRAPAGDPCAPTPMRARAGNCRFRFHQLNRRCSGDDALSGVAVLIEQTCFQPTSSTLAQTDQRSSTRSGAAASARQLWRVRDGGGPPLPVPHARSSSMPGRPAAR